MFVRQLKDCPAFIAGDGSLLRELLHPEKETLRIRYSLAHAKVKPGQKTKPHRLRTSEVYYIMAGKALMHIGEESFEVLPQCAIYIPPRSTQCVENTGDCDLEFLCIVEPAWKKQYEEVFNRL